MYAEIVLGVLSLQWNAEGNHGRTKWIKGLGSAPFSIDTFLH